VVCEAIAELEACVSSWAANEWMDSCYTLRSHHLRLLYDIERSLILFVSCVRALGAPVSWGLQMSGMGWA
jgi:hypothetical protein